MIRQLLNTFIVFIEPIGRDLVLALISSSIFYIVVVHLPKSKSNFNTKTFVLDYYLDQKQEIINALLGQLKKNLAYNDIKSNLTNFDYIRKMITNEDMDILRNLHEPEIKELAKEIYYHLIQLQTFVSYELAQDYIQEDIRANKRLRSLISWITQFGYAIDSLDVAHEYDKRFCNDIHDFVRGITSTEGQREKDDFIDIIESAYRNSLIRYKLLRALKKLLFIL